MQLRSRRILNYHTLSMSHPPIPLMDLEEPTKQLDPPNSNPTVPNDPVDNSERKTALTHLLSSIQPYSPADNFTTFMNEVDHVYHLAHGFSPDFFSYLEALVRNKIQHREASLPKDVFPRLLAKLMVKLEDNAVANIQAGFRKCGIIPLDKHPVLARLPPDLKENPNSAESMDHSFVELLK